VNNVGKPEARNPACRNPGANKCEHCNPFTGWRSKQQGDLVWALVTNHPDFPSEAEARNYYLADCRKDVQERIAAAWNSGEPREFPWRVELRRLGAKPEIEAEQLELW